MLEVLLGTGISSNLHMPLTSQQIEAFETDGYLSGIDVVGPELTEKTRQAFDEFEARVGHEKLAESPRNLHFEEPFAWDLVTHPRVLDIAESLIGPDILLLGTRTFCKYGPSDDFVAWHQDLKYWGLDPSVAINAWIAIDDCNADNGCLRYIPGSHKWEVREHAKAAQAGNLLSINQELPLSEDEEARAIDVELEAGQISVHDGMLTHGSNANHSTRRRCGMAMVYVPAHVRPAADCNVPWVVSLVRGSIGKYHFDHRSGPNR